MNHFHFPVNLGTILFCWNSEGLLSRIDWSEGRFASWQKSKVPAAMLPLIDDIRNYFYCGEPIKVIPWELLDQSEWTPFQKSVYFGVSAIPHGATRTYGWVAHHIKKPAAARAVGQALRRNPLPILIPCHRVLGNSSLGGFMGKTELSYKELQMKMQLIQLEENYINPPFSFLNAQATGASFRISS